jgi:hypothetical protein
VIATDPIDAEKPAAVSAEASPAVGGASAGHTDVPNAEAADARAIDVQADEARAEDAGPQDAKAEDSAPEDVTAAAKETAVAWWRRLHARTSRFLGSVTRTFPLRRAEVQFAVELHKHWPDSTDDALLVVREARSVIVSRNDVSLTESVALLYYIDRVVLSQLVQSEPNDHVPVGIGGDRPVRLSLLADRVMAYDQVGQIRFLGRGRNRAAVPGNPPSPGTPTTPLDQPSSGSSPAPSFERAVAGAGRE